MSEKDKWLHDLFIDEAKPALDRHANSGGVPNEVIEEQIAEVAELVGGIEESE